MKMTVRQEEFAFRSGLGLRFVRELEQGKETVRLDKVNQALSMFGCEAVPGNRIFRLSDAYDMLPVNVIMPEEQKKQVKMLVQERMNVFTA